MSLKKILIAAGFAAVLPLAALAAGGGSGDVAMGHWGGMHGEGFAILHGLQLTDTQKTQIHQLMATERQENRPIEQQLLALHKQISDALFGTAAINTAQITQLSEQAAKLHEEIATNHLNTAIQVRALLTQDQIAKAASVHQQLESLHEQERQLMGHPDAPSAEHPDEQ